MLSPPRSRFSIEFHNQELERDALCSNRFRPKTGPMPVLCLRANGRAKFAGVAFGWTFEASPLRVSRTNATLAMSGPLAKKVGCSFGSRVDNYLPRGPCALLSQWSRPEQLYPPTMPNATIAACAEAISWFGQSNASARISSIMIMGGRTLLMRAALPPAKQSTRSPSPLLQY